MFKIHQNIRSRLSNTSLTAGSAYLAIISSMALGIFSIPMALRFLDSEEFGLWSIIGQSMGYLLLIDFGVSWSASRMLVEPIRSGDSRELNSWWTVLILVLVTQSLLVLGIGLCATDIIVDFFEIPPRLIEQANVLWIGMLVLNSIQLPFRALTGILYCQNRWYVMHLTTITSSWINLFVFLAFLYCGYKTSSYLFASIASISLTCLIWYWSVKSSGIKISLELKLFEIKKLAVLFTYSSGIFLVAIAAQLSYMSQSLIIGKILGVGAVAAFAVSCKSSALAMQMITKASESFNPKWLQMYIDGNSVGVMNEWRRLMKWLIPIGAAGALTILIFNRPFSILYGGPMNHISREFDALIAISFLTQIYSKSLNFIFPMAAKIKGWCKAQIVEALVQIGTGIALTIWIGEIGLIIGIIIGNLLISLPFSLNYGPRHLKVSKNLMIKGLLRSMLTSIGMVLILYFILKSHNNTPKYWWPSMAEFIYGSSVFLVASVIIYKLFQGRVETNP